MELDLHPALKRREFAALRVLAAAMALRDLRVKGTPSPEAHLHARDELNAATDVFAEAMEAES